MSLRLEYVKGPWYCTETKKGWEIMVPMEYLPDLSVNHYKHFGTEYTKPEVKKWMGDLSFVISTVGSGHGINWQDYQLIVRIGGNFKDKRMPDLHNFLKVTLDAVEDATLVNDQLFKVECGVPEIGEPRLLITVKVEKL